MLGSSWGLHAHILGANEPTKGKFITLSCIMPYASDVITLTNNILDEKYDHQDQNDLPVTLIS